MPEGTGARRNQGGSRVGGPPRLASSDRVDFLPKGSRHSPEWLRHDGPEVIAKQNPTVVGGETSGPRRRVLATRSVGADAAPVMAHVGSRLHVGPVHDVIVSHAGQSPLESDTSVPRRVRQEVGRNTSRTHGVSHHVGEAVGRQAPEFASVSSVGVGAKEESVVIGRQSSSKLEVLAAERGKARHARVRAVSARLHACLTWQAGAAERHPDQGAGGQRAQVSQAHLTLTLTLTPTPTPTPTPTLTLTLTITLPRTLATTLTLTLSLPLTLTRTPSVVDEHKPVDRKQTEEYQRAAKADTARACPTASRPRPRAPGEGWLGFGFGFGLGFGLGRG